MIRALKNHINSLTGNITFDNADEEQFCERYVIRIISSLTHVGTIWAFPFNIVCTVVVWAFMPAPMKSIAVLLHLYNVISQGVYLLGGKRWINSIHLAATNWIVPGLGYSFMLVFRDALGVHPEHVPLMQVLAPITMFFVITCIPYNTRKAIIITVCSCLIALSGFVSSPLLAMWFLIITATAGWSLYINRLFYLKDIVVAKQEYRVRLSMLPKEVVQRSVEKSSIEEVFKPELRACVCLSSDWRNFQNIAQTRESAELGEMLEAFYDEAANLLERFIPAKNFFIDWIADELFVVLYSDSEEHNKVLVNQALDFSLALCESKIHISRKYNIDLGIDIGISSGKAHLGLFGRRGHMKATALGEVPGRSRRLQGFGKKLRHDLGERDRVLFDSKTLLLISKPYDIGQYEVPAARPIRNLPDQKVFYLEALKDEKAPSAAS